LETEKAELSRDVFMRNVLFEVKKKNWVEAKLSEPRHVKRVVASQYEYLKIDENTWQNVKKVDVRQHASGYDVAMTVADTREDASLLIAVRFNGAQANQAKIVTITRRLVELAKKFKSDEKQRRPILERMLVLQRQSLDDYQLIRRMLRDYLQSHSVD
jgi:hypothetical protein